MGEFLTGLSNILMLLTSVVCAYLYRGYRGGRWWIVAYGLVGMTSVVATIVHCFAFGDGEKLTLWIFVYLFLSLFLGALTLALFETVHWRNKKSVLISAASALVAFALLLTFKLTQGIFSYIAVVLGAGVAVFLLFYSSVCDLTRRKNKKVWYTFFAITVIVALAVIFNFVKFSIPLGKLALTEGGFMHLIICAGMVLIALGTRSMLVPEGEEEDRRPHKNEDEENIKE